MLSAMLVAPGRIELLETPIPEAGPGEVVLRVRSALTCGADLRAWRSGAGAGTPLGHEYAGEVARVGEGVKGFREGDAVMTAHAAPCGKCFHCTRGEENLCDAFETGMAVGGFAEYVRVGAPIVRQNMFLKPRDLQFSDAAFLEPLSSVVQGLESVPVSERDTVVILGSGAIGLLFLLALKAVRKPARILVAGRGGPKLALARQLGADRVIDADRESVQDVVREETGGQGAEVILECAGSPEVWESMLDYASRASHILLFGGCPNGGPVGFDTTKLHYDQISLIGACRFTPRAVRTAYELLARGDVRPGAVICGSYPLAELPEVFDRLERGEGVKYEILPPTRKD